MHNVSYVILTRLTVNHNCKSCLVQAAASIAVQKTIVDQVDSNSI